MILSKYHLVCKLYYGSMLYRAGRGRCMYMWAMHDCVHVCVCVFTNTLPYIMSVCICVHAGMCVSVCIVQGGMYEHIGYT